MPKWVWYVLAGIAAWFLFLRNLVSATGGFNLAATAGNNTPQTGYAGYPPGWQPPAAPSPTYSLPYPVTVGNPTGQGTSVAQDIGSIMTGIAAVGSSLLGSGGIGGLLGKGGTTSSSDTPPTWVNPWGIG